MLAGRQSTGGPQPLFKHFQSRIMKRGNTMSRCNPFKTYAHCLRYALRRAFADGDTFHIILTGDPARPRIVLSDREIFARDDIVSEDIEASADPFGANTGTRDTV